MPGSMRVTEAARVNAGRYAGAFALLAALATGLFSSPVAAQAQQIGAPYLAADGGGTPASTTTGPTDVQTAPKVAPAAAPPASQATPTATDAQVPPPAKADGKDGKPSHDLSPMGMFLNADPVVKTVMVILAMASVMTWAILLVKVLSLALAKRQMRANLAAFRSVGTLSDAGEKVRRGVGALLLSEAEEEIALSNGLPSEGVKERVAMALSRTEARVGKRIASGTGILATIGSIGPFVGLFGTVWGIMGSFVGIANSNTTSLAVVAPGIAEALLATGIGLVAAIPAVVIYNALARSVTGYRALVGDAVALIMRHLSRDLDRRLFGTCPGTSGLRVVAE